MKKTEGNIIDILNRKIFPGEIFFEDGFILDIVQNTNEYDYFICPGFIDAHVHIESSMLTPEKFSNLVIQKGTVAVINDPHEIANVLGIEGIRFMINNSRKASIKTFFGIPSCVPATSFDSAGSRISSQDVEELANTGNFIMLSEVMNVPGVLCKDPEVMAKIDIAKRYDLKIDGHAPGLSGERLIDYIRSGISSDHECVSLEEAKEKIICGMKILIREGSASKNYEALKQLIKTNTDDVMFCTDDSHPDELISEGDIDKIVKKAIKDGFDLFDVLKIATINPVKHYKIPVGILQKGDPADFIKIENLQSFQVLSAYIDGNEVYNREQDGVENSKEEEKEEQWINNFNHDLITLADVRKRVLCENMGIKVTNGELLTTKFEFSLPESLENMESDIKSDILKIVYINRYTNSKPQVAFIKGFTLKWGAFASSISHDSHNILAVGCNDKDIVAVINAIIKEKGGIVVKNEDQISLLSLPIGGIMSNREGSEVASLYHQLNRELKVMGCTLDSPFMTLSFMSLIIIPAIKIGEKGLFDYSRFDFLS